MRRKRHTKAPPEPLYKQGSLVGLSFEETFELVNPETEWGTLKLKESLSKTQSMFQEQRA